MDSAKIHTNGPLSQQIVDDAAVTVIEARDPAEPELYPWLFGIAQNWLPPAVNDAAEALIARRSALAQTGALA